MSIIESNQLNHVHSQYSEMVNRWLFWEQAYDGGQDFIDAVLDKHERESDENYTCRKREAEVFNYCETIVNLFSNYLTEIKAHKTLDVVASDPQWDLFLTDVDLYGLNYDVFWSSAMKMSGVYGFVGNLINKPNSGKDPINTKQDEINNNIYPYYTLFSPNNILDWTWTRNQNTARPELVYLKLRETGGTYLIWTKFEWERWDLEEGSKSVYRVIESGENPLGEIPFVWYRNVPGVTNKLLGVSDVKGISRTQAAITRNLSHGNEVIKYAAFPMLLKPDQITPSINEDLVGVTAVMSFDPDNPAAKAEWLESAAKEPIDAILEWIGMKIEEIYRTAHLSGIQGQSKVTQAKSGVALKYEFQQLFSVLSAKADSLDEAERQSIVYWMMWQNLESKISEIVIKRPKVFVVEDINTLIESILTSGIIIKSPTFHKAAQRKIVKLILSTEDDAILAKIDDEIEGSNILVEEPDNGNGKTNI